MDLGSDKEKKKIEFKKKSFFMMKLQNIWWYIP